MAEVTLESLAARLLVVEAELAEQKRNHDSAGKKDWRRVVGISSDNEFTRAMLAEIEAASDAERQAAIEGRG